MSQQERQQLSLRFHLEPSSRGKKREKSKRLKRQTDSADTTSTQFSIFDLSISQPSDTPEFPAILKTLTLRDRLSFLSLTTQTVKSSETSERDSTLKEKVGSPYWNEFCQAMSEWLSLPTKTDYAASGTPITHGCQSDPTVRFWFSTTMYLAQSERCLKMFWPSSTFSVAGSPDSASTKRTLKKTLTYRVYPKGATKKVWMQRIHAYRQVYNKAIAYLNQHQGFQYINTKGEKTTGKKAFRSFCKTLGNEIIPQWCKDLEIAHALDNALFEAYSAWSKTKRGEKFIGKGKQKKLNPNAGKKIAKFRSIRDKNKTIQFDPLDYKDGHWKVKLSKELEKAEFWGQDYCLINFDGAPEMTYNKGRWYANFPVDVEVEDRPKNHKFIAILD